MFMERVFLSEDRQRGTQFLPPAPNEKFWCPTVASGEITS